jgi:hypothetical protein
MTGEAILKHVAAVIPERRRAYGDPKASMEMVAKRWSTTLGVEVSIGLEL